MTSNTDSKHMELLAVTKYYHIEDEIMLNGWIYLSCCAHDSVQWQMILADTTNIPI